MNRNIERLRSDFENRLFKESEILISTLRRLQNGKYIYSDVEARWQFWKNLHG
jgi:hypothetical protein